MKTVKDFDKKLKDLLTENPVVKQKASQLHIEGADPWNLYLHTAWENLGNLSIESASIHDLWAIKEWYEGLTFRSRHFISIFPMDYRIEKYIAMHLKKSWQRKILAYNAWVNETVIGHFFVEDLEKKPVIALGLADTYQKNKLGYLFIAMMINTLRILGFKCTYLTTMHENKTAFQFYKKLGFTLLGDTKVPVAGFDYHTDEYEMRIDLDKFQ